MRSPATQPKMPAPIQTRTGNRSSSTIKTVAPKITSGIDRASPVMISAPEPPRGGGDGDDVVERHDRVGDDDDADRIPNRFRSGRFFPAPVLACEADGNHQQNHVAGELDERHGQRLQKQQREKDAQEHGGGAKEDRPAALRLRQRTAGHGDDQRIVIGENDVDPDDLDQGNEKFRRGAVNWLYLQHDPKAGQTLRRRITQRIA